MEIELIIMGVAVLLGIVVLLSSKIVRAICFEAIFHPRDHCKLKVSDGKVTVSQENLSSRGGIRK